MDCEESDMFGETRFFREILHTKARQNLWRVIELLRVGTHLPTPSAMRESIVQHYLLQFLQAFFKVTLLSLLWFDFGFFVVFCSFQKVNSQMTKLAAHIPLPDPVVPHLKLHGLVASFLGDF